MSDDIRNPRPGMVVRAKSGKNVYRVVEVQDMPERQKPVPNYVVRDAPKIKAHVRYEQEFGGDAVWYTYPPVTLSVWRRLISGGELLPDDWSPPRKVRAIPVPEQTLAAVRSALLFYADPQSHVPTLPDADGRGLHSAVEHDGGVLARKALALLGGEP